MKTKMTLPTNGFGTRQQQIVLSIPAGLERNIPQNLDVTLLDQLTSPPKTFYLWRRWSNRIGDDEDVIHELFGALGTPTPDFDWEVDWQASAY